MPLESRLGLKEDERIVMVVRPALVTVMVPGCIAGLFLLAPFFFMVPLLSWETLGKILMGASIGISFLVGLRIAVKWFGTAAVMTDRRLFVIQRDGLFTRKVHALPYVKMQGVSYRIKGLRQTVFRYGTVLVRPTAGKPLRIPRVRHPELLESFLAEAVEGAEGGGFGDLLHAISDMESRELLLLKSEIERVLAHRGQG